MKKVTKTFSVTKALDNGGNAGQITITTPALDRDHDRVIPAGILMDNYMQNPVVQWGHNYHDPWATIGKATRLEVGADSIVASFEFREPASEGDPMHIIRSLWTGGFINAASIGFYPTKAKPNESGGMDFEEWELLEFSLVPVPANQEALRLAVKSLTQDLPDSDAGTDNQTSAEGNINASNEHSPDEPALSADVIKLLSSLINELKEKYNHV